MLGILTVIQPNTFSRADLNFAQQTSPEALPLSRGCTLHTRPETMTEIFAHRNSQAKFPAVWVTQLL